MRQAEMWAMAYLVNALWQAPLLLLLALACARMLRRVGPAAEHRVWVSVLLAAAVLPMISATPAVPIERLLGWWTGRTEKGAGHISVTVGGYRIAQTMRVHGRWDAVLAVLFGLAVLYAGCRLLWRYRQTRRLVAVAQPVAFEGRAAELWQLCCERFGVRRVQVAASPQVAGPLVCGVWRRWLLLPVGWAEALSEAELGTVFAHECAHLQRGDFGKNLLYEAMGLPVAWHPAVWAMRHRLAESREWVCDAVAAGAMAEQAEHRASRGRYARSLLRLASLVSAEPGGQFHAIGIFDANTLEERIMRLTQEQRQGSKAGRIATMAACGLMAVGVCVPAWALAVHTAGVQETPTTAMDGQRVLPVKADVMAGELLSQVHPVYPPEAKAAGVQGKVVLAAVIGTDGTLQALKLVSGPPELAKAAWAAVTQWTWKPYLLNGEPTPVQTTITVNFHLED